MLDPQARALIDLMVQRQVPPVHTLRPAEARRYYLERRGFTQPDPPPVAEVRDLRADGGVGVRLYRPRAGGVLPVLVYFHGGGWTIGDLDTHDVLCRQLCAESGNPCKHRANGPLPTSRTPNSIPFAVTRPLRTLCAL